MTVLTPQLVHDRLRDLERLAPTIDTTELRYSKDERPPFYYEAADFNRSGKVSTTNLVSIVQTAYPEVSDSKARTMIRAAVDEGLILRLGASSATAYRTAAHQRERDADARALSAGQVALGRRAERLGLSVSYRLNTGYAVSVTSDRLNDRLERGDLVTEAQCTNTLSDLTRLIEDALLS